jgi:hypothetical protein
MRRRAILALLVLAAVTVLGVAAPAHAHVPDRAVTAALVSVVDVERAVPPLPARVDAVVTVAPVSPAVPWLPLLILAALLMAATSSRRAVVGVLVALLAVFAFETGRHSVHHLGEQRDAARCVVESVASNLSGAVGEAMAVLVPAATADLTPRLESIAPRHRSLRPDRGRAPPFLA